MQSCPGAWEPTLQETTLVLRNAHRRGIGRVRFVDGTVLAPRIAPERHVETLVELAQALVDALHSHQTFFVESLFLANFQYRWFRSSVNIVINVINAAINVLVLVIVMINVVRKVIINVVRNAPPRSCRDARRKIICNKRKDADVPIDGRLHESVTTLAVDAVYFVKDEQQIQNARKTRFCVTV